MLKKNKPYLIILDDSILVSLWTFLPTLISNYKHSFYMKDKSNLSFASIVFLLIHLLFIQSFFFFFVFFVDVPKCKMSVPLLICTENRGSFKMYFIIKAFCKKKKNFMKVHFCLSTGNIDFHSFGGGGSLSIIFH